LLKDLGTLPLGLPADFGVEVAFGCSLGFGLRVCFGGVVTAMSETLRGLKDEGLLRELNEVGE